jgi:hypothetical protein
MINSETTFKFPESGNQIVFVDLIGRLILAKFVERCSDNTIKVVNPTVVYVAPKTETQMQIQFMPIVFPNITVARNSVFYYRLDQITLSDVEMNDQVKPYYEKNIDVEEIDETPISVPGEDKIINFFDKR